MNCPKCGYERQNRDDVFVPPGECPACGVVYAKHDSSNDSTGESTQVVQTQVPTPNLRPSPVDALSLRKARERVEKRLREQQGKRVQDDRHARTLELAKQLASEEVRRRQEEWKQAHAETAEPEDVDAGEASGVPASGADPAAENDPSANRPQDADQTADEMMTSAAMEETVNSPEPAAEIPAVPTDDGSAAAADDAGASLDSDPRDEVDASPPGVSGDAADAEPHPAAAPLSEDPEAEAPAAPDDPPAAPVPAAAAIQASGAGSKAGLSRLQPVVAWLILCAGVIGAVLSWTTINEVQAGAHIPTAEGVNGLPLGLLLGFAYLATGVLGFAFFWVSSLISTQLKDIYRLLLTDEQSEGTLQDEATEA
jgi:hypothetical protein